MRLDGAAGHVRGSHAYALVRATEVGLNALEQRLATEDVEAMRRKLNEVEMELKQRKEGVVQ